MKRFTMLLGLGLVVITLSWVFAPAVAEGIVPERINIQGILRDGSGNPVADGSYSVIFTIYNDEFAGTVYWAETTSVTTAGGLFNHRMGAANAIPDTAIRLATWLGIKVGTDPEMTPRPRLVSVSHAFKVSTVQGASGGTISSTVAVAGDVLVGAAGPDDLLYLNGTDPNIALELRSGTFGGDPYIDFTNDASSDYDARIQLLGDAGLKIDVPSTLAVPNGKVGIGTDAPGAMPGLESARLEIADEDGSTSELVQRVAGAGGGSSAHYFVKSRGTLAAPSIVQPGDLLGNILFIGHDGTDFSSAAAWIRGKVDGTPGTDDMPGRLEFLTTPDGSATPATQMTINNAGRVGIGTISPGTKLQVEDQISTSVTGSSAPGFTFTGDLNTGLFETVPDELGLATNGVNRLHITSTGNVGIGTPAPIAKLDVNGGKVLVRDVAGPATAMSPGEYYNDNSIVAWGRVAAAGALSGELGVTSVAKGAAGIYTITTNTSATSPSTLIPLVQVVAGAGVVKLATVEVTAVNTFVVRIYTTGAALSDNDFTFTVTAR